MQVHNREKWIDSKASASGVFTKSSRDGCKRLIKEPNKDKNNQIGGL